MSSFTRRAAAPANDNGASSGRFFRTVVFILIGSALAALMTWTMG